MKFHLAVYRLVKDPALKQASGLCSIGSKWRPWRSTAQFPEPLETGSEPQPIQNKKSRNCFSQFLLLTIQYVSLVWFRMRIKQKIELSVMF